MLLCPALAVWLLPQVFCSCDAPVQQNGIDLESKLGQQDLAWRRTFLGNRASRSSPISFSLPLFLCSLSLHLSLCLYSSFSLSPPYIFSSSPCSVFSSPATVCPFHTPSSPSPLCSIFRVLAPPPRVVQATESADCLALSWKRRQLPASRGLL